MANVPLKQRITVSKPAVADEWGNGGPPEVIVMKARVDEVVTVVQNKLGDEAISGYSILLDKLADISYDDTIEYTNELGVTVSRTPIKIEPIRMINGKASLTGVYC